MLHPDALREAISASKLPVSGIAERAGIAPTTLYSFMSGATGSLRASSHAAVEAALSGQAGGLAEDRATFQRGELDLHPALLQEAASYGLDATEIARTAVERAVKTERMKRFSEENREAIESWNDLVKREGLWSDGYRAF
ncbi:type II toxin-antitoxin system CcdA family antitoxin [Henriciella litoralis]|uniref:type II toxin-antitoxin system CcdA family antitoxin n=1 Tax=Henriciella litoralis TaxID=568102 RepID=UPI0009FCAA03|nr:type II toxin-antitoxin system CcdA family antitoxin [Henriciella litoralis]